MINQDDELKRLLQEYGQIIHSERNAGNKKLWKYTRAIILDKWRGIPQDLKNTSGKVPFYCWPSFAFFKKVMDLDIGRYHRDVEYFLKNWLKMKIYCFNNFEDDNYYSNAIPIWLGVSFESTLFGVKYLYSHDSEPWLDRSTEPLADHMDLEAIEVKDFNKAGLIPLAKKFYEEINEAVSPFGMEADFISWGYGVVHTANAIRGIERMLMDYLVNTDFANDLLAFLARHRNEFFRFRKKYLHGNVGEYMYPEIWNDDAAAPLISPQIYKEVVYEHEKSIYDFQGGFNYYHNCGPMDPLVKLIANFKNILMIHSGPYSDYRIIAEEFGKRSAIEHCVRSKEEIMESNYDQMLSNLRTIRKTYEDFDAKSFTVRATAYVSPKLDIKKSISHVNEWIRAARTVLG